MTHSAAMAAEVHFNPLPPHGGRPVVDTVFYGMQSISIHSLRMEGDLRFIMPFFMSITFQSTPSAWRETDTNERISL